MQERAWCAAKPLTELLKILTARHLLRATEPDLTALQAFVSLVRPWATHSYLRQGSPGNARLLGIFPAAGQSAFTIWCELSTRIF